MIVPKEAKTQRTPVTEIRWKQSTFWEPRLWEERNRITVLYHVGLGEPEIEKSRMRGAECEVNKQYWINSLKKKIEENRCRLIFHENAYTNNILLKAEACRLIFQHLMMVDDSNHNQDDNIRTGLMILSL